MTTNTAQPHIADYSDPVAYMIDKALYKIQQHRKRKRRFVMLGPKAYELTFYKQTT